jgi:hypothetical protein
LEFFQTSLADWVELLNCLDTVMLERRFTQLCNDLDVLSARFEEWRLALFDEKIAGISFLEIVRSQNVYLDSEANPPFTKLFGDFQCQDWSDFLSWLDRHYSLLWESHKPGTFRGDRSNWEVVFSDKDWQNLESQFHDLAKHFD